MPPRFWELGAGCLTFVALNGAQQFASPLAATVRSLEMMFGRVARHLVSPLALKLSSLAVMLGLIALLFIFTEFAEYITIAVVLLTAFVIASTYPQTAAYKILAHPAAVYVGRISYSLYLWHWSVLSLSRWTIGIHVWSVPLQAALMLLLADASFRYVENPIVVPSGRLFAGNRFATASPLWLLPRVC